MDMDKLHVIKRKEFLICLYNNFFTNACIKLAIDITVPPDNNIKDNLRREPGVIFSFKSVSELEINNIIDKLHTNIFRRYI